MPVVQKHRFSPCPKLYHSTLRTTFCGINHPLSTAEEPIHQYLGIKYASVPARFRQSRLFKAYPSQVDASCYGPICPQPKLTRSFEESLFGVPKEDTPKQVFKHDEFECLNLNITCPAGLAPQARLPVMLWVHGGGERGCGSSWVYDGGPLVRKSISMGKPVILVTFNFRLGLFGFASSPLLLEDNKAAGEEGVGNYGLRDQRKAMEWLRLFISGFGGDPSNITVFGESSGAGDILYHLLSSDNQTRPIFQRAIIQSAVIDINVPDVATAGWQLCRFLSGLRVSTVEQLRAVDAELLTTFGQCIRATDDGIFLRPNWKDFFNPLSHSKHHRQLQDHVDRARNRSSVRSLRSPSRNGTSTLALPASLQPLIIGDCSCDSMLWSTPISLWTAPGVVRRIKAVCQSLHLASNLMRAYEISSSTEEDEIQDRILDLVNDARIAWPTECAAQSAKLERGGRGVWRYVFDQEGPLRGVPHHAADLVYLFDTTPLPESAKPHEGSTDMFCTEYDDVSDEEEGFKFSNGMHYGDTVDIVDEAWGATVVDEWAYARVRDTMQERWICFAHGEAPWREDKVFVFGPEGETGERSGCIFEGRRRKEVWKEVFEPLGTHVVHKVGTELSRGPPLGTKGF